MRTVRQERSFGNYSRGAELIRSIHAIWKINERSIARGSPAIEINQRIKRLADRFDLTLDEWYYWSDIARSCPR